MLKNLVILILTFAVPPLIAGEFNHESELSLLVQGGNSNLKTYYSKMENTYKENKNAYKLQGHYTYGESLEVITVRNFSLGLRYDRTLPAHRVDAFIMESWEGDSYSGVENRYNTDAGLSYDLIDRTRRKLKTEAGVRYTVEEQTEGVTDQDIKSRFYIEGEEKLKEHISLKGWVEYLYNFTDPGDTLLSFEPSFRMNINEVFSLKLAYKGIYDRIPPVGTAKKYDYRYTTSLLASF